MIIRRIFAGVLAAAFLLLSLNVLAADGGDSIPTAASVPQVELSLPCKSAVLIEQTTGEILYEANVNEHLPIASVTKVMTLLLAMEAVEAGVIRLEDKVPISELLQSIAFYAIFPYYL